MLITRPTRIEDALAERAKGATPVAGATDLWVHWPTRLEMHARTYVDLSLLAELRRLDWSPTHVTLGALTTYWDVIRDERFVKEFPLLVAAARQVGAIQIQSRGTWAGNIANASPGADGVPALMACDAEVVLRGPGGERAVRLDEFYRGYKKMEMGEEELILAIRVPRQERSRESFEKVGARRAQAITKVGLAMAQTGAGWRIVANSMAPYVKRCRAVEAGMDGGGFADRAALLAAAEKDVAPIDDIRSDAEYRMRVFVNLLWDRLTAARV